MPIARSEFRCRQSWHPAFLRLLPKIEAYIVPAFQRLRADEREDAIHEAIGQAFLAFVVLKRRGRGARPTNLSHPLGTVRHRPDQTGKHPGNLKELAGCPLPIHAAPERIPRQTPAAERRKRRGLAGGAGGKPAHTHHRSSLVPD